MKREEALEYMNRYLDHDLNEEETETLFRHLGESPDARADFEFLQGLSDKLESLPDVKPPVSLVDAILPRLDELDRLAPLEREEPEQPPVVMLPGKQQMPPRRKAAAFWRSTMGRAVGGTAIAAAVLGIFVATYKPQEMPNAEVTSTAAVSDATDDTLVSGGSAEKKAVPDLTDPSTEVQELQPDAQKVPEEEGPMQNKVAPPAQENPLAATENQAQDSTPPSTAPDSSGSQDAKSGSDTSSDAKQGGGGAESGTGESNKAANNDSAAKDAPAASDQQKSDNAKKSPSSDSKPNATPNENDKNANNKNTAPKTQAPPADAPTATQKVQPNEGISSLDAGENESADKAAPNLQDSGTPESGTVEGSEADTRVYSLMAAPTEWTSPDSTYLIAYSPGTLTLLKGDRSEELRTLKIEGEATNGVWSADGKTFTYDLVKPDGTTASQMWKIEETTLKQGK